MIRYQLFKKNSPWGVLKDGNGNQFYQHLIDFPNDTDDTLRFQFLKDEFDFNLNDLKNSTHIQANPMKSPNTARFLVNLDDYPEWDLDTLMSKDFLIMYDDEKDKITYWAVEGHIRANNNKNVEFLGTRDWIFEIGADKMFVDNRQVIIARGMPTNKLNSLPNISPDGDNSFPEGFENFQDGSFTTARETHLTKNYIRYMTTRVPLNVRQQINDNLNNGFAIMKFQSQETFAGQTQKLQSNNVLTRWGEGDIFWYGSRRAYINSSNEIENIRTGFAFGKNNWNTTNTSLLYPSLRYRRNYGNQQQFSNNVKICLLPHFDFKISSNQQNKIATFEEIYPLIKASPNVYQITELSYNPLDKYIKEIDYVNGEVIINCEYQPDIDILTGYYTQTINGYTGTVNAKEAEFFVRDNPDDPRFDFLQIPKNMVEEIGFESEPITVNDFGIDPNPNNRFNNSNIAKLRSSNFERYVLKLANGSKAQIIQDYIPNQTLKLGVGYTYDIIQNHSYYKVLTTGFYNQDLKYGLQIEDLNNFSYGLTNSVYENLLQTQGQSINQQARYNKQQSEFIQKQNKLNNAKTIFNGIGSITSNILGGAGAMDTGNSIGVGSAIGGTINAGIGLGLGIRSTQLENQMRIASNVNSIQMLNAKMNDAQNSPNQLIGNGDDLMGVLTRTNPLGIVYKEILWKDLRNVIGWHFQMYGVNLGSIPRNINDYIDKNYHFNYLQTGSTLENWTKDVPNSVRQIIDKSLANGLTIWHYRNKNTFKGIKNWDVNNVEMVNSNI